MDLTTDRRFHPLAIRKCCCFLPAFFCLLFMALSSPAWAQDNAASKDAPADQAVAAEQLDFRISRFGVSHGFVGARKNRG